MKKAGLCLAMLVGVLSLQSCSTYKIQVRNYEGEIRYTPMKRDGASWIHYHYFLNSEKDARKVISEWKTKDSLEKVFNKLNYIRIK